MLQKACSYITYIQGMSHVAGAREQLEDESELSNVRALSWKVSIRYVLCL